MKPRHLTRACCRDQPRQALSCWRIRFSDFLIRLEHLNSLFVRSASHIVLYNKSGTNISAAYLAAADYGTVGDFKVQGFVAESVTYRLYMNSSVVNAAIKPYQTEGVYHGKRDIHRRPFEVCAIPEYDNKNPIHAKIVQLTRSARKQLAKWAPKMEGGLAKVREKAREIVADEIKQIDDCVVYLLETPLKPSTKKPWKQSPQPDLFG